MNKIQELIQQKLALEIANKAIQIAGLEAELEQAREKIAKLESQLEPTETIMKGFMSENGHYEIYAYAYRLCGKL